MAQGKGGALGTVAMISAFVAIGVVFYWLSITAVRESAPEAVEVPEAVAPSEAPAADADAGEAPAAN
jgi:hypothetical protein